jgi:hypothetical protein
MESVDDKKPWAVDQRRVYGLRVVLPERTWLLLMRIGERSLVTSPDRERTSPVELGRIETFEAWTPAVTA